MRILGYPAEKISIITTYNGQASLLRDVVKTRCAENPLIGVPHKVCCFYEVTVLTVVIVSLSTCNRAFGEATSR